MRKLTLTRRKALPWALFPLNVCVRDEEGDCTVGKDRARVVGEIKNGEEKSFEIPDAETDVTVAPASVPRWFMCEKRAIPAGSEDVSLAGKVRYSPFLGNPFLFDDPDETTAAERKKRLRRASAALWIFIASAVLLVLLCGAAVARGIWGKSDPKTGPDAKSLPAEFVLNGLRVTLNSDFGKKEQENNGSEETVLSDYAAVTVIFFSSDSIERFEDVSADDYLGWTFDSFAGDKTLETSPGGIGYVRSVSHAAAEGPTVHYVFIFRDQDGFRMLELYTLCRFEENCREFFISAAENAERVYPER